MAGISRITLVGPIAEPGKPAIGGYESANLRVLAALRQVCRDVRACTYPRTARSRLQKAQQYASGFARLSAQLILEQGHGAAVHITPLCRHFLAAELMLALAARARGNRLTVDLRAGMQESWYRKSSALYRMAFRRLLSLATAVSYEGEEYGPWLAQLAPDRPRYLLPNFVPAAMLRTRALTAPPAAPKLVYVGALSEAKGVEAALRVYRLLKARLPGTTFILAGRCDPTYRETLERMGLLGEGVMLTGPLPPPAIEQHLDKSHFFVFLSHWFGEGHSNALTEAMARGCVPLVTPHGFARSVVACPELVIPDREQSERIAARLQSIWQRGRWQELSDSMVRRVAGNFTDVQAIRILRAIYPDAL